MLGTDDITGGTITVSNFGAIGGKFGSPTLNIPEVAIVAIGRMQKVVQPLSSGKEVATVMNVHVSLNLEIVIDRSMLKYLVSCKVFFQTLNDYLSCRPTVETISSHGQ